MGTNHNMNRSATIMLSMAVLCLLAGTSMAHYTAARHPPYSGFGFDHPFFEDEPDIFYREVSDDLADQVTSLKEQLGQSRATAMSRLATNNFNTSGCRWLNHIRNANVGRQF